MSKKYLEKQDQLQDSFVSDLKKIANEARSQAYRAADHLLVVRNWLIGWRIVEQEQVGKERAEYGKKTIDVASQILTRFPFHTSASTPMGGHLRDRVSAAKVITKNKRAKGFEEILAGRGGLLI